MVVDEVEEEGQQHEEEKGQQQQQQEQEDDDDDDDRRRPGTVRAARLDHPGGDGAEMLRSLYFCAPSNSHALREQPIFSKSAPAPVSRRALAAAASLLPWAPAQFIATLNPQVCERRGPDISSGSVCDNRGPLGSWVERAAPAVPLTAVIL